MYDQNLFLLRRIPAVPPDVYSVQLKMQLFSLVENRRSFFLWLAGTYFLIEDREVLEVYRAGKDACYNELKKDEEFSKILDPPDTPVIRGKYHHRILSIAVLITTALVMCLLLKNTLVPLGAPLETWVLIACIQMVAILKGLEYAIPQLAKEGPQKSWFYRHFIE